MIKKETLANDERTYKQPLRIGFPNFSHMVYNKNLKNKQNVYFPNGNHYKVLKNLPIEQFSRR